MKLKKFSRVILIILVVIFILSLLLWSVPFGQAETKINIQDIVKVERVGADDFGLSEPIFLPGNPFYFLKNWAWNIKKLLSSDKINWHLGFAASKLLDIRKLAEKNLGNLNRIEKAIAYYEKASQESEQFIDNSSNQNKKASLEKVVKNFVFYKKAFNDILYSPISEETKGKIFVLASQKEKFFNDFLVKLGAFNEILKVLNDEIIVNKGIFSSLQNLEAIQILESIAPDKIKDISNFQDQLYTHSLSALNNASFIFGDSLNEIIKVLPGDKKLQRQLLWNLEERSGRSELFEKIRGSNSDFILNNEQIRQCLEEFDLVQKQITDFRAFIGDGKISINVESALISAEGGLKYAQERIAIGEEKYACNLIQSAKAKISNASRLINLATRENIKLRIVGVEKKISDLRDLIQKYNQEEFWRLYDLMDQMDEQLLFIKSSYQIDDFESSLRKVDDFDVLASNFDYILDIINGNNVLMKELSIEREFFSQGNLNRFANLCSDKDGVLIIDFVILPFCRLENGEILSME